MKRSVCPKCGYVLRLTNWREECPQCGINMTYYNKETILLQDAERAEIEFALFQPHMDRAKASFIGSPLTIARLCCSLLPAGALFLPLATLHYTALLENKHVTYTLIQLIEVLRYRQWDRIFGAMPGILPFSLLLFGTLLGLILHVVGIVGSCTRKGKIFLFSADAAMLTMTGCGIWLLHGFVQNMSEALPQYIDRFSVGIGAYLFPGLLGLCLIMDVVVTVCGIPVRYTQRYIANVPAEDYFAEHPEYSLSKYRVFKI